ncbi:bcl-2-related ovarian killer protein isoform X3 [Parus major]|uniref:bcl-2-related ovarian killer protein isoform X3 n=1 Tax=Parus major TaxID=9157 RepID=UPI0008F540D5|nr:bcl-2-related ovarian killer protein isoform X3 [Parus major]
MTRLCLSEACLLCWRKGRQQAWEQHLCQGLLQPNHWYRTTACLCSLWESQGTDGDELEYIRPNVYRNIARQLNISLHSETVVSDAFLAVAAQIFTAGITWGKVVSLYAVAAGLAVDCVRHAQPAMVHTIVDCLGEFVRKTLVTWLKRRGGWADITKCVVNTDPSLRSHWLVAAVCSFGHFLKAIFFVLLPER